MVGAQIFQLYANLLFDEFHQPWDKIIKAQMEIAPWADLKGELHKEQGKKTWESFLSGITFHMLMVFRPNAGEEVKYYITNTLKKPNQVLVHQFFKLIKQVNSYLEILTCLYFSPKANSVTKLVQPLDDSNLATYLLCMCPIK